MATTRTKKTIKFNPLAVQQAAPTKRTGLLTGVSVEPPKTVRTAKRAKPVSQAKPSVEILTPATAVGVTKSATKKVTKKTPAKRTRQPSKSSAALSASGASLASEGDNPLKSHEVATKRPLFQKKRPAKQPIETVLASAADIPFVAPSTEQPNKRLEASPGNAYFGWLHRRPSEQALDGKLLSAHQIVRGPQEDTHGFYEADGSFVSLMHLEGPIDQTETKFFPLALVGFAIGGALGLAAASLLNIRKNAIFLARQPSGEPKYVSLDSNGIDYLKRMVHAAAC